MIYVFDTSPFSTLFKNYYPKRFPSLWSNFNQLVDSQTISSVREVAREIEDSPVDDLRKWAKNNPQIFFMPTTEEAKFVTQIFEKTHFQGIIEKKKMLKGGKNADAFVIARAKVIDATVITVEKIKPNANKIPNICKYFNIPCYSLEEFMEEEGWRF